MTECAPFAVLQHACIELAVYDTRFKVFNSREGPKSKKKISYCRETARHATSVELVNCCNTTKKMPLHQMNETEGYSGSSELSCPYISHYFWHIKTLVENSRY